MPDARAFVPGLELSRAFYGEIVAPLLGELEHAAARIGTGSEVLGLDTQRSTDHGWGPRLQIFVAPADVEHTKELIEDGLPAEFRGWPTRFGWDEVSATHHVDVATIGDWLERQLGLDPRRGLTERNWLALPQQLLLQVTAGDVFHDPLGELARIRESLAWYPHDVWLWLLACQWRRLDQEEPFVGRAAEVGDELGSRVVAARLVRDAMRLCFLLERRYAPYSKWLGSAFRRLEAQGEIGHALLAVLAATDFAVREDALVDVVRGLARLHNAAGVTEPVDDSVRPFHSRPFRVLGSSRFVDACLAEVSDGWLRSLPLTGGIDQFVDSSDVLAYPGRARATAALLEAWAAPAPD